MTATQRLKRVFCGGRLRVIASIENSAVIERILTRLGRDSESLDRAHSSRAPPSASGRSNRGSYHTGNPAPMAGYGPDQRSARPIQAFLAGSARFANHIKSRRAPATRSSRSRHFATAAIAAPVRR